MKEGVQWPLEKEKKKVYRKGIVLSMQSFELKYYALFVIGKAITLLLPILFQESELGFKG